MNEIRSASELFDSDNQSPLKKQTFLVIAGCDLNLTPVVSSYLDLLSSNDIKVLKVTYKDGHRIRFIFDAIYSLLAARPTRVICVNHQSIPILFLISHLYFVKIVYWKLETYNLPFYLGIIQFLEFCEYFIKRSNVDLIVPSHERKNIQLSKFRSISIVNNAPLRPYINVISKNPISESISLVVYGNMRNPDGIFLNEWVSFCKSNTMFKLSVFGKFGENCDTIQYFDTISHDDLIKRLTNPNNYHFSIVGYRPIDINTRFAAPNKAIESLACGLPLIAHYQNSYVCDIIERFNCGIILDFADLPRSNLFSNTIEYEELKENSLLAAQELCLDKTLSHTALWF